MLQPVIMIGCGGSGQKAVRYVRDAVRRQLEHSEWPHGVPRAWQFLGLDTLVTQESPGEIPTMPANDYVSVGLNFNNYQALDGALLTQFPIGSKGYEELIGWRPAPSEIAVPLTSGAGKIRAVGRAAGVLSLASVVRPRLTQAFTDCSAGMPELVSLSEHLEIPVPTGTTNPDPVVVVLGSNAGGTGAGIMLDVIDLVRRTDVKGNYPVAVVFSSDIFGANMSDSMAANGLAFMSELMSAYWDSEVSGSALIPSLVSVRDRGPHSVFVVGRKNIDGIDLGDSRNVYRAVGEALASWVTSSQIQTDLNNFVITNWSSAARENRGGYPFGTEHQAGVLSSFGSATISIGRDRFREYTTKLLMRQVIDFVDRGHLIRASQIIGERAESMTAPQIRDEIVRNERDNYLRAARIFERGGVNNDITDAFVSESISRDERAGIMQQLTAPLQVPAQAPDRWLQLIQSQRDIVERECARRAEADFTRRVGGWSSAAFETILRATSEFMARYGIHVTTELVRAAQTELHDVAAEVRQESKLEAEKAVNFRDAIAQALPVGQKGSLQFDSENVTEAIQRAATSALFRWRSITLDRTARLMEEMADQVFRPLTNALQQSQQKIHHMVTGSDGEPALIESWPQNDGTVPNSFTPSPVEFFLEPHTEWPDRLQELLGRSMPPALPGEQLPSDPVNGARHLLIAREFPSATVGKMSRPLVWTENEFGGRAQWGPGGPASVVMRVEEGDLGDRIHDWLMQGGTAIESFLREGLRSYLNEVDSNGNPVADHPTRVVTFRQRLGEALKQSRPLFEINPALMAKVHPQHPKAEYRPIVQGFPFPAGHPARAVVEDTFRATLPPNASTNNLFSSRDAESVLITSFLQYPVHPMVVKSVTSPVNVALGKVRTDAARLRGGFWQWSWTKVLMDAVPLPDEVRAAMIRGFVVARLIGAMNVDVDSQLRIGNADGGEAFNFPPVLLTPSSAEHLLPALLEAFVLTFGDVDTRELAAFDAYKALHDLGASSGETFTARGQLLDFIEQGTVPPALIVDRRRYEMMGGSDSAQPGEDARAVRVERMIKNLDDNLRRYETLREWKPTGQEYRTHTGTVVPENTLTVQLLDELTRGYDQVKSAIQSASAGSAV